jgi:hypothetical protein
MVATSPYQTEDDDEDENEAPFGTRATNEKT